MKKNRSRKRALMFEQLETKATPAALLVALAPLDDATHNRLERLANRPAAETSELAAAEGGPAAPAAGDEIAGNWQFSHSVFNLLRFVEDNTLDSAREATVCSPPTWDQCRVADEMMQLKDADLRMLVMADSLSETADEAAATRDNE